MLTNLSIKNYALIESLSVGFNDKLSTITGETGAGKSILLGALGLVLGNRADLSTLKSEDTKCVIEASFFIKNYNLKLFFENNDIDYEEETIVRREILPSGKSRAFINDTPANLQVLQQLGEKLIDVHSQHQTLQLSNQNFQFQILDAIAQNELEISAYKKDLITYKNYVKELDVLNQKKVAAEEQYEYNVHLLNELTAAKLLENEQEEIEQKLAKLNHIEEIKLNLSEAYEKGLNDEIGIQNLLNSFANNLNKISSYSKDFKELFERINSVKIEFDDIVNEIELQNEQVNFDPDTLDKLNNRLQLIFNLQKKHGVGSINELLSIQNKLSEKVAVVENSTSIIKQKEEELNTLLQKLNTTAKTIFNNRKETIPLLIKKLEHILSVLGMKNTRFKIELQHTTEFFENGKDKLNLLISANKGVNFGLLKKVASGGELSRIMLAVKFILSEYLKLPTIIFDEIDTGVSGDISQKMADIMDEMSDKLQVITITHLPQIAAKGKQHYKVFKQESENGIVTKLIKLADEQRVMEIAEMLDGKNISKTAVEHAKQLLNY